MIVKGITPKERKYNVLKIVNRFSPYLLSSPPPGSVLNCIERVAVAYIAREALTHIDGLPDDVCTLPNFDFYSFMEKNQIGFDFPAKSSINKEKQALLVKSVHALIRHQHRLDENWYRNTQSKIQSIFLHPDGTEHVKDVNESDIATKVRCHQIYCEIMSIAITSSAVQTYFLTLGEKLPDLPTFEEAEKASATHTKEVQELNMMSLLKNVHWDIENVSPFAPFYRKDDINEESPEFIAMGKEMTNNFMKHVGFGPKTCFMFAPYDILMMLELTDCFGYRTDEKLNLRSFDYKCDGVTRFQTETIATGYTGAVQCDY